MILIDSDLDPDPDAQPKASTSKRVSSTTSTQIDRRDQVPSARTLGRFLREAQAAVRLRGQVSVLLTTNTNIRRLNRQFRGKDKATDVLSFPAPDLVAQEVAGDLAVSVPTARRQAREHGHTLSTELKVLILHGLLHLSGYDHERDHGQMARRERLLRGRLGLPQGLIERSGDGRDDEHEALPRRARDEQVLRFAQNDKVKVHRSLKRTQDDKLKAGPGTKPKKAKRSPRG